MTSQRWDTKTNIRFIKEYQSHPCLWKTNHRLYKNRDGRQAAYKSIADVMEAVYEDIDLNVDSVKAKIRVLRNTYNLELTKIRKSVLSGVDEIYVPKIQWIHSLDFLKNCDGTPEESTDNVYLDDISPAQTRDSETSSPPPTTTRKKPCPLSDAIKAMESFSSLKESHNSTSIQTRDSVSLSPPPITPSKRKKPRPSSDSMKVIKTSSSQWVNPPQLCSIPAEDEFDTFGRNIGQQLRSMPLEDALETQVLLQSVLTRQRIKSLQAERDALFVDRSSTKDPLYEVRVMSKESQDHISTAPKIEYSDSEEQ